MHGNVFRNTEDRREVRAVSESLGLAWTPPGLLSRRQAIWLHALLLTTK